MQAEQVQALEERCQQQVIAIAELQEIRTAAVEEANELQEQVHVLHTMRFESASKVLGNTWQSITSCHTCSSSCSTWSAAMFSSPESNACKQNPLPESAVLLVPFTSSE